MVMKEYIAVSLRPEHMDSMLEELHELPAAIVLSAAHEGALVAGTFSLMSGDKPLGPGSFALWDWSGIPIRRQESKSVDFVDASGAIIGSIEVLHPRPEAV